MRLLLDTHLLLWAVAQSRRLSKEARYLLEDPDNELYFSAASLWEISIKSALRRNDFRVDPAAVRAASLQTGFVELAITGAHAIGVASPPPIHRDPFDRLLIAQSQQEPLILLTNDALLAGYGTGVRTV